MRNLFPFIGLALFNLCASAQQQSAFSFPVQQPGSVKAYHDGGMRDLAAIGKRNIGCGRGLRNWYSLESQADMGREFSRHVEENSMLVVDPVISEYINRIGQNLVRNSDARVPFTIKVLDSNDINAFALPGGFFYIDSGLILAAENEAQLAAVMAHEIAHVAACHAARANTRNQLLDLASLPLIFVGGGAGFAAENLVSVSLPMGYLRFSRGFESEADFLGVEYMYEAGYDPQAMTAFFEKVKALEKHKPGVLAKAFSTHPQTKSRIEKTQREINTLLPIREEYKLDSSEFQDVKQRLLEFENREHPNVNHGESKPVLRRASDSESN